MSLNIPAINNLPIEELKNLGVARQGPGGRVKKVDSETNPAIRQARITQSLAKIEERTQQGLQRKAIAFDSRILQTTFPFWDDSNRGVPNPFIRSGLFSVRTTAERKFIENMEVPSLSNYNISYTGQDLQQDDLSVWLSLINMARDQPMSEAVYFTGYQLVKDLGWRMHSESYKRAQESIKRLKVTGLEIASADKDSAYSGSLIREYSWTAKDSDGNAKWMVSFEPRLSVLFLEDTTTLFEWETRKKIGTRATVAQWLHSFYASHREPTPLPISKLYVLSRSEDKLPGFKRTLKNALQKLVEVGFLKSFAIENDVVYVEKRMRPKLIRAK